MVLLPNDPIYDDVTFYVNGLNLNYLNGQRLKVLAGSCRDVTNTNQMVLDGSVFIDVSPGYVNGAGSLDFGTLSAYTMYDVYVIGDSSKYNPTSAMISNQPFPVLPAGYDMYRVIGHVTTLSAPVFKKFYSMGAGRNKTVYYEEAVLDSTNLASLNPLNYTNLVIGIGAGTDLDIVALPLSANRVIAQGVFLPGQQMEFLPYVDPVVVTPTPLSRAVMFLNGGAAISKYCWRMPLGLQTDPVPSQPKSQAIRYRGNMSQLYISGYIETL